MNRKGRDFTIGDPGKQLLLFAWPLVLSMLLQNLYNMADTLIVGRYLGDTAMGAVGTCGSITNVVLMLIGGCTQGMAVVLSQFVGAKDEVNVKKTIATGLYIIVGLSVVFGIIGIIFSRNLLMLINVSGEALEYAESYLVIIFAGALATALYNMGNSISRSLGDSITPMVVLIVTSILNIFLNILFVAFFKMGVPGVAYATILATAVSAIVCWCIILKKMPV
ncbi:MAG: polysaccharide biosynthesis C-terminal domain-containing protein, partial [Lachnospiraceae bacterium]|nr:polysaccharide biosynthesis C-terminal domain-containing protein [Lachnospiraceae bacterium]